MIKTIKSFYCDKCGSPITTKVYFINEDGKDNHYCSLFCSPVGIINVEDETHLNTAEKAIFKLKQER